MTRIGSDREREGEKDKKSEKKKERAVETKRERLDWRPNGRRQRKC